MQVLTSASLEMSLRILDSWGDPSCQFGHTNKSATDIGFSFPLNGDLEVFADECECLEPSVSMLHQRDKIL